MKGILYSIIAALLIVPVISLILFNSQLTEKNIDINIRSNELEYFSISVGEDLGRFLKIAGRRAIISAVSKVITTGTPLADVQANLTEMITNGTLDGVIAPLIDTNNLNTWRENVSRIANNSGFNINFLNMTINITQSDSYNVLFSSNVFLNISDPNVEMGVAKNLTVNVSISIEGIEDPLFPLKTLSYIKRVVQISNFTSYAKKIVQGSGAGGGSISRNATFSITSPNPSQKIFVTSAMADGDVPSLNLFAGVVSEGDYRPPGMTKPYILRATNALSNIQDDERIYLDQTTEAVWDLENLTSFAKDKYYKNSTDGPSFLDRLEGRLNLSNKYRYGLETFVNKDELSAVGLGVSEGNSFVDYMYWNGTLGSSIRNGGYDNIFSWLKIDQNHANIYGVDQLI